MEEKKINQTEEGIENKSEEHAEMPNQNEESGDAGSEKNSFAPEDTTNEAMKAEENKGSDTNAESADVDSHKALAIVGYIIPILFFIPLVTDAKNNTFAKFHANQQLNLLLFWVIGQIVGTLLSIILIGLIILPLVMVAGVVFMIMGIINSANGEMKKLPLIGGFELIK